MKVSLDLPEALVDALRARADERGASLHDFARAALEDALVLTDPAMGLAVEDDGLDLASIDAAIDRGEAGQEPPSQPFTGSPAPSFPAPDWPPPVPGDAATLGPPARPVVTGFVGRARRGPVDEAVVVDDVDDFVAVFGAPWRGSRLGPSVEAFFAGGGEVAVVVRASASNGGALEPDDLVGPDAAARGRGLHALDHHDVDRLLIPRYTRAGDVDDEVLAAAAAWCADRGVVLLDDVPAATGADEES